MSAAYASFAWKAKILLESIISSAWSCQAELPRPLAGDKSCRNFLTTNENLFYS